MAATAIDSPLAQLHLDSRDDPKIKKMTNKAASRKAQPPFRLLDLPAEIRTRIYEFTMLAKPGRHVKIKKRRKGLAPRLALLLISHQLHEEASYVFYTSQVFRMFFVQDFQPLPTVYQLPRRYRKLVTSVELVFGPGWTNPPRDWRVTPRLGLQDLIRVQTLQVFVELDPSHPSLEGYRISEDFYTNFAGKLLHDILAVMPAVKHVQLDSNPSVQPTGPLVTRLLQEIAEAKREVRWGPGPKGRAADNVFVELLSKIEPWLKPKFPGRANDGMPLLIRDEHGNWKLSAPVQQAIADAAENEDDDDDEDGAEAAGPSNSRPDEVSAHGGSSSTAAEEAIVSQLGGSGSMAPLAVGDGISAH